MNGRTTHVRADVDTTTIYNDRLFDDDPDPDLDEVAPLDFTDATTCLLVAVLERALLDLGGRGRDSGHLPAGVDAHAYTTDAFDWMMSDADDPWTFGWVCDQLRLDVSFMRTRMFVLAAHLDHVIKPGPRGAWMNRFRHVPH